MAWLEDRLLCISFVSQESYIMTEKALLYFADFNFCFVLVQNHGKIY